MPRRPERPHRKPTIDGPAAVDQRKARAVEEPLDVRLRTPVPYPLLEVRNPIHGTLYLVMLPEFPAQTGALCTCTDFARRGLGTCKHIEAGVRWLSTHPDAPPLVPPGPAGPRSGTLWRKVDQRLALMVKDPGPLGRRWRRAGAVLYERATSE